MSKILTLGTLNDNEISCLRKNSAGKFCQRLKLLHRTVNSQRRYFCLMTEQHIYQHHKHDKMFLFKLPHKKFTYIPYSSTYMLYMHMDKGKAVLKIK